MLSRNVSIVTLEREGWMFRKTFCLSGTRNHSSTEERTSVPFFVLNISGSLGLSKVKDLEEVELTRETTT